MNNSSDHQVVSINADQYNAIRNAVALLEDIRTGWTECNTFPMSKTDPSSMDDEALDYYNQLSEAIAPLKSLLADPITEDQ